MPPICTYVPAICQCYVSMGNSRPWKVGEILTQQQMAAWCQTQLSQTMWQQLQQVGQLDLALALADGTRLRANFFLQNAGVSVALRRIASQCPTLAELTTPEIIPALLQCEDGLILVTGATGSGKSTTLAAMIDFINRHQRRHILTLEDPIEFIHRSQRSLIQQRELGRDTHSFDDALRAALREDPDVILLGELRDTTTVRLALTAAENRPFSSGYFAYPQRATGGGTAGGCIPGGRESLCSGPVGQ
ncbi:Type II secretory pathway, ATPase PulE/Tfp pilus assembly pathway, ATPase PilB [Serratia fonticola]|uniref:Type II secretory pathway, ATPase PulE/Tfp pilus assembly pathway, ATPase PilB n=1 Tax=Serratia fonticola TaxID=47917 RepID=A0A4U9TQY2_SERFO|nr:Type II secretory pathway, ATPase PulE/Tfp pilus assembly pathway, ATPase PilB [Serratia fonticola]